MVGKAKLSKETTELKCSLYHHKCVLFVYRQSVSVYFFHSILFNVLSCFFFLYMCGNFLFLAFIHFYVFSFFSFFSLTIPSSSWTVPSPSSLFSYLLFPYIPFSILFSLLFLCSFLPSVFSSLLITCPPCLPTPFLLFPFLSFSSLPSHLLSFPYIYLLFPLLFYLFFPQTLPSSPLLSSPLEEHSALYVMVPKPPDSFNLLRVKGKGLKQKVLHASCEWYAV